MKLKCEVIEDLLILYDDNVCSDESKKIVEKHLAECERCTRYLKNLRGVEEILSEELPVEQVEETRVVQESFRKIKNRWRRVWISIAMLFPIMGLLMLGINEIRGEGIAFTNIDDIYRCRKYLHYIEQKDFEKAVECIDFTTSEYQLIDSVKDMTSDEFQQYMKKRYLQKIEYYDNTGLYISDINYQSITKGANGWQVDFKVKEHYPDGSTLENIRVTLGSMDMQLISIRIPEDADNDLYLRYILHLFIQDDPLHYQRLENSFSLEAGEKAVITWADMEKWEETVILEVYLINKNFNLITSLNEKYRTKDAVEAVVPGEYHLGAYLTDGRFIDLGDYLDIEITNYE